MAFNCHLLAPSFCTFCPLFLRIWNFSSGQNTGSYGESSSNVVVMYECSVTSILHVPSYLQLRQHYFLIFECCCRRVGSWGLLCAVGWPSSWRFDGSLTLLDPQDEGCTILRKVGSCLRNVTALHPRPVGSCSLTKIFHLSFKFQLWRILWRERRKRA